MDKKRVIKSYEKLDQGMRDLLEETYPNGFTGNVIRLTNAQNETYFAVPLETEEANYLIKVPIEVMKGKAEDEEEDFDNSAEDNDDNVSSSSSNSSSNDDFDDSSSDDPSYNQGFDDDMD